MSERINEARDSAVGTLDNPTPVFDGAKHRELFMLICSRRISPPAVIRDNGKKLGAVSDKRGNKSGKHRLITDHVRKTRRSSVRFPEMKDGRLFPYTPSSHAEIPLHDVQKAQLFREWDPFREGNQLHLRVFLNPRVSGSQKD